MRYTLHNFEIDQEDQDYGIILSHSRTRNTGIDERHRWLEAKDGIRYRSGHHRTINDTKSVIVDVAIPEQHPLFNIILILSILRIGKVGHRPGVVASILDLLADTFYDAGVPYEYKSYPQQ